MANDFVERLWAVFEGFIGCADTDGRIIDLDAFSDNLEEFAYILQKMDGEVL